MDSTVRTELNVGYGQSNRLAVYNSWFSLICIMLSYNSSETVLFGRYGRHCSSRLPCCHNWTTNIYSSALKLDFSIKTTVSKLFRLWNKKSALRDMMDSISNRLGLYAWKRHQNPKKLHPNTFQRRPSVPNTTWRKKHTGILQCWGSPGSTVLHPLHMGEGLCPSAMLAVGFADRPR